jgi:hypothetical protein
MPRESRDWEKVRPIFDSALSTKQQNEALMRAHAEQEATKRHLVATAIDPTTGYVTKYRQPKDTYDIGGGTNAEAPRLQPPLKPHPKDSP